LPRRQFRRRSIAHAGEAHQGLRSDSAIGYQTLGELKLLHLSHQHFIEQGILARFGRAALFLRELPDQPFHRRSALPGPHVFVRIGRHAPEQGVAPRPLPRQNAQRHDPGLGAYGESGSIVLERDQGGVEFAAVRFTQQQYRGPIQAAQFIQATAGAATA
jgi:hypothetical protein